MYWFPESVFIGVHARGRGFVRLLLSELPELASQGAQLTGQMRALLLSMLAYSPYAIFDVQDGEKDEIDALISATEKALMVSAQIGMIVPRISNIGITDDFIICNGQLVDQADYPELMEIYPALLKTTTQFYAPDLRGGRHILHTDAANGFGYLTVGGNNFWTLQVSQLPAHSHSYQQAISTPTSGGEIPGIASSVASVPAATGNAGGNQAIDLRNPYAVVYYYLIGR